jgi:hypothetical protein
MVVEESLATWPNDGGWWRMLRARYMMLEGDRMDPGGPVAHRDSSGEVDAEDCYQGRVHG